MTSTGRIFDIQRFCTHDGPGIRTTVFLKGCPLRCEWCHNPESQSPETEILFSPNLCIGCGACAEVCPTGEGRARLVPGGNRDGAERCLRCAAVCPGGAIELSGRGATVAEVLAEAEKDRVFYEESGGGITLSGGEPMAQPDFALALLQAANAAGLHTCVETCGYGSAQAFEDAAAHTGLFLWDIKDTNSARHRANTGVDPQPIWDNLRRVDALGVPTLLRCVLIAGLNTDETHAAAIARICSTLQHVQGVELLPHHPLGGAKYQRLGLHPPEPPFARPDEATLAQFRTWLQAAGVRHV